MGYRSHHTLVVPPAVEPFTLAALLTALRLDPGELDEEAYLVGQAAREYLEEVTGRAFITQTRELRATEFPGTIPLILPRAPVREVVSVVYVDDAGSEQTLVEGTDYRVTLAEDEPARVFPIGGWPAVKWDGADRIFVRYLAGYGDTPDQVPPRIRAAVLMLARFWFDNPGVEAPMAVQFLVRAFGVPHV
jgi:uncharacterized phiE125 gp8 family phage protein